MTKQEDAAAIHTVYLGLGSNIGDRDANLSAALRALDARSEAIASRTSPRRGEGPLGSRFRSW